MTSRCAVCRRSDRAKVDLALKAGSSLRSVASKYSIARTTLERHHKAHGLRSRSTTSRATSAPSGALPVAVVDRIPDHDLRAEPLARSFGTIIQGRISVLEREASSLTAPDFARVASSLTTSLIRLSRITGEALEISDSKLTRLPAFGRIVDDIVRALRPYPEAMAAVADALERIERGGEREAAAELAGPPGGPS